jgi:dTDP-4-dehydrorhamnose reductase
MKILVTGANGQLGQEIRQLARFYKNYTFIITDLAELDITDYDFVEKFVKKNKPDVIINCAGFTAVDRAETEAEAAMELNARAVGNLAKSASVVNAFFIHISTDYVFDGLKSTPYIETDKPNPLSFYARTKLEGENETFRFASHGMVIRTSWLYSEFQNNFVGTIIRKSKEKNELNVVFDQVGTPTYAKDLAKAILDILPGINKIEGVELFHFSNEGVASWYDFAVSIVSFSGIDCIVRPILTIDFPLPAIRPSYSVMDKSRIKTRFGITIPHWRTSLHECMNNLPND